MGFTYTPNISTLSLPGFKKWIDKDDIGPFHVEIGRGRRVKEREGNKWFAALIKSVSTEYLTAATKGKKSAVLNDQILSVVLSKGAFVKLHTESGCYYQVEDSVGRVTSAQAMRDCLSHAYKSSRQHKQKVRKHGMKQPDPIASTSSEVSRRRSNSLPKRPAMQRHSALVRQEWVSTLLDVYESQSQEADIVHDNPFDHLPVEIWWAKWILFLLI